MTRMRWPNQGGGGFHISAGSGIHPPASPAPWPFKDAPIETLRGLANDPSTRYPDLRDLLDELKRRPDVTDQALRNGVRQRCLMLEVEAAGKYRPTDEEAPEWLRQAWGRRIWRVEDRGGAVQSSIESARDCLAMTSTPERRYALLRADAALEDLLSMFERSVRDLEQLYRVDSQLLLNEARKLMADAMLTREECVRQAGGPIRG